MIAAAEIKFHQKLPPAALVLPLVVALGFLAFVPPAARAGNLELCNAIDCRASEISAGLLTGPWKQACRKSEASAISYCQQSGGQIKYVCQTVCPAGAWPTNSNRNKPPIDENLRKAEAIMRALPANASAEMRDKAELKALRILGRYAAYQRGMGVLHNVFKRRRQMQKQHRQLIRLAKTLNKWGAPRGGASFNAANPQKRSQMATAMAALIVQSMAQSEYDTGMGRSAFPTVIKLIDDLAGLGADAAKFMQKYRFERGLKYINRGAQVLRAADSASKLKAGDEASARKFASDFMRLLPNNAAPGYSGPASALVQDNVVWTRSMTEASTDGLKIVTNAMKTGKVNSSNVDSLNQRLAKLKKGPWTKESFNRVIKETVEDVPGVGYVVDMFSN
jgi:hypothetical protein